MTSTFSLRALSFPMLLSGLALAAACGGSDDDNGVVVLIDANTDLTPADGPEVVTCTAPEIDCSGTCTSVVDDELNCGSCGMACTGGAACISSACVCPPGFITANPTLLGASMQSVATLQIGFGGIVGGAVVNALAVGFPTALAAELVEDQAYPLNGMISGPFAAAGYDVNTSTFVPSAAYAATAGTVTFGRICRDETSMAVVGVSGTIDNATFSSVEGLFNPMLVDGGCSFVAPTGGGTRVTFDFNCPAD